MITENLLQANCLGGYEWLRTPAGWFMLAVQIDTILGMIFYPILFAGVILRWGMIFMPAICVSMLAVLSLRTVRTYYRVDGWPLILLHLFPAMFALAALGAAYVIEFGS